MANLNTQSFQQLVQSFAAAVQSRTSTLINFALGGILRAVGEATASVALWLQALVIQFINVTRLASSSGSDVDTFIQDFGLQRLGAKAATGTVTFSRFTAGSTAPFIANGTIVKTADTTQSFTVYADPTNVNYSATLLGYTMPAGVTSINVPVQAAVAGTNGNVAAGTISLIASTVVGVDTVVNSAAFTNGVNQESDTQVKVRFVLFWAGLSKGNIGGLAYAMSALQVGVQYTLTEDYDYNGTYHPGYFYVVADDGSGSPPASFITAVTNAVQSVRPLSIMAGVFAPVVTNVTVALTIHVASGYTSSVVISQVGAAVAAGINGLGLGNGLISSQIASWAYAIPGVTSVSGVTINGVSGDAGSIAANVKNTIKVSPSGVIVSAV